MRSLKIDKSIRHLFQPLNNIERLQLEKEILSKSQEQSVFVWQDTIIDGFYIYQICMLHNIEFKVVEMTFENRESVIAWICERQLKNRNITDEARRYLIGKQYHNERIANKGIRGSIRKKNHLSESYEDFDEKDKRFYQHTTALKIALDNDISYATVQKYAIYANAIDTLLLKDYDIGMFILAGKYRLSHENVVELSKLTPEQIRMMYKRIEKNQQPYYQYQKVRGNTRGGITETEQESYTAIPSVKDMPQFDPDAEITGLTLTIPSWTSSIERTRTKTDLSIISNKAREKLISTLNELQLKIAELLNDVKEH